MMAPVMNGILVMMPTFMRRVRSRRRGPSRHWR
jgi:hypothetical protein